jgi:V/A-type H+-transporting ATPase subunit I
MIQKMSKVRIIGPRAILPNVLDKIYRFGKLHIDKVTYPTLEMPTSRSFALKEMSLSNDELKELARLENVLGRVDGLLKSLSQIPEVQREMSTAVEEKVDSSKAFAQKGLEQLEAVINKIEQQKEELYSRKLRMDEETGQIMGFGKLIESFASIMEQAHDIDSLEIVGFTVDKNKKGVIDLLKEKLHDGIADDYEIFTSNMDRRTLVCIIATSGKNMLKIKGLFADEGVQELDLPEEFADKSLKEIRDILKEKKTCLPEVKTEIENEIKEFGLKNINRLKKLKLQIEDRIAYFGEVPKFAETKFTFIMRGWLPKKDVPEFKDFMKEACGPSVVIEEEAIAEEEKKNIPVTLRNPAFIRPFETIMGFFDPPAYGTIDPTWVLAIFFPLIFGMILGDIFYGLLIVAPGFWLWREKTVSRGVRDIGYIFMLCGISTILWGIFFGEFLGDKGHLLHLTPVINREHGIVAPLALALGFGVVHIVLSLIFKGIGAYKEHHKINKHVLEVGFTILLILAVVTVAITKAGLLPESIVDPTIIVLGIAFVMVWVTGGLLGGMEIFGVLGNILSYARIMAIGLSSVILAMVANKIATGSPSLVFGVTIAIVLHVINLILGIFGPTVHGLRLHFVESFQKFVKFEGRSYKPFKRGGEIV